MSAWVSFKQLREQLDFEAILRHYSVEVKRKGDQHHGFCPLPLHQGKRNSPSFSANLKKGIFQCFGCGAKGNLLEFAALMENASPEDGAALRTIALKLRDRFFPGQSAAPPTPAREHTPDVAKIKPGAHHLSNVPLDFELKGLDPDHPYLVNRGFSKETITRFGLGFCSRGFFSGRIAIPLRDQDGKLIGYAGRLTDENAVGAENPKYKFPATRQREGTTIEFRKSLFLYNGHRVGNDLNDLIVVEGFPSVWYLTQLGWENVVATMGASCSEEQAKLIVSLLNPAGKVWVLGDGDTAGERFAKEVIFQVARKRACRWVELPQKRQPTDFSLQEMENLLR